jgi:hypothetical protein
MHVCLFWLQVSRLLAQQRLDRDVTASLMLTATRGSVCKVRYVKVHLLTVLVVLY